MDLERSEAPQKVDRAEVAAGSAGPSGDDHGKHGHREPPGDVDEELDAPLIGRCERGGEIEEERGELQYQDELLERRAVRRRFRVHVCKCGCCERRHQGRHPFQASDALGEAGWMLGSCRWRLRPR